MKFRVEVIVMPHKELLDPQGKTVSNNLKNIDIHGVEDVRIGKNIQILLEAENAEAAEKMIEVACKKLLANTIMESYTYSINQA
jgi:phosphoribosylformylglycinamidine synthase subunit PurS